MAWAGTLTDFLDGVSFTGAANSNTTPSFVLLGGKYQLAQHSSGTASADLQTKTADGTFVSVVGASPQTAAVAVYDLPPGTYQIVFGASAGTEGGSLVRVPYRAA